MKLVKLLLNNKYMLKVDEVTKEKAINKLKEIKNKPDEITIKTKQYLEGLVKIPFETFYEEPITRYMKNNNSKFINIFNNLPKELYNFIFEQKTKYTNKEITSIIVNIEKEIKINVKNIILNDYKSFKLKTFQKYITYFQNKNIKTSKNKNELQVFFKEKIDNTNNLVSLISIYDDLKNTNIKPLILDMQKASKNSKSVLDSIQNMELALNKSIHGHEHAKNQIMKIIGQWMNGEKMVTVLVLKGPPGIGKTSLASKGLTKCLTDDEGNSRPFSFIALGGSSNGSFLEGHSYTYMNSTCGENSRYFNGF